jgi:hypothetical protein
MSAKNLIVRPIPYAMAYAFVVRHHYSHKSKRNSQLHFGVFWARKLCGAIVLGPPLDRRKLIGLVADTAWNGFMELNRMVLTDECPRNSESRALAVVLRWMRKYRPDIEWVVSFADACQCGDGAIYRACGFALTAVKRNRAVLRQADGKVVHKMAQVTGRDAAAHLAATGGAWNGIGTPLSGFQIRYIYFLNPAARSRLTVPELPYSAITDAGASMYRGCAGHPTVKMRGDQPRHAGANPSPALQSPVPTEIGDESPVPLAREREPARANPA